MFCSVYKWKISRALDSGKPLSGRVRRHLDLCSSCREFKRLSEEAGRRLSEDAVALLERAEASLGQRIIASLDIRTELPPSQKSRLFRPALATASALAMLSIGLIWLATSRSHKTSALDSLFAFDEPRVYLETALQKAESPYQQEILELEQVIKSATDFFKASLDTGLGK